MLTIVERQNIECLLANYYHIRINSKLNPSAMVCMIIIMYLHAMLDVSDVSIGI